MVIDIKQLEYANRSDYEQMLEKSERMAQLENSEQILEKRESTATTPAMLLPLPKDGNPNSFDFNRERVQQQSGAPTASSVADMHVTGRSTVETSASPAASHSNSNSTNPFAGKALGTSNNFDSASVKVTAKRSALTGSLQQSPQNYGSAKGGSSLTGSSARFRKKCTGDEEDRGCLRNFAGFTAMMYKKLRASWQHMVLLAFVTFMLLKCLLDVVNAMWLVSSTDNIARPAHGWVLFFDFTTDVAIVFHGFYNVVRYDWNSPKTTYWALGFFGLLLVLAFSWGIVSVSLYYNTVVYLVFSWIEIFFSVIALGALGVAVWEKWTGEKLGLPQDQSTLREQERFAPRRLPSERRYSSSHYDEDEIMLAEDEQV